MWVTYISVATWRLLKKAESHKFWSRTIQKIKNIANNPKLKMEAIANYDNPDWGYQRMVMVQPINSFDDCSDVIDKFIQYYLIALCKSYVVDFTVI